MATKDDLIQKLKPILTKEEKVSRQPQGEEVTPPAGSKAEHYQEISPSSQGDFGKAEFYQTEDPQSQPKERPMETDLSKVKIAKDVQSPDSYERMMQITDPNKPLSYKEQEQLDKRRKSDAIFSALGDGITALSNIYFASEGANDMSADPSQSLSAKSKARWDKIKAERDAKDLRFYEAVERRRRERKEREDKLKLTPYQQAMMEWRDRNAQSLGDYRQSETERKAAADKAKAEETKRVNDARIASYNASAWAKYNNDPSKRYSKIPVHLSEDEIVDVDSRLMKDPSVVNKLFTYLSEEEQKSAGSYRANTRDYATPTQAQMMRAIFDALPNNKAMQAYVRYLANMKASTTSKNNKEAQTPKEDFSAYKEATANNNTDFSQYKRK